MAQKEKQSADKPQLDSATVATLLDMAQWWTENKNKMLLPLPLTRPRFRRKGGGKTRSIRLDEKMITEAEKKAKKESARTGGTFNTLIEVLVWEYLGRPKEFVELESTEPSE